MNSNNNKDKKKEEIVIEFAKIAKIEKNANRKEITINGQTIQAQQNINDSTKTKQEELKKDK